MKILLTGATSFTGLWFASELSKSHEVISLIHKNESDYTGLRKKRLELVKQKSKTYFDCPFGSDTFFSHLKQLEAFDIFCHHGANVYDYKSPHFDPLKAASDNTKNIWPFLKLLKEKNCSTLVLTGSVFEPNEGEGPDGLKAVSPYGLSKGITSDMFTYYCKEEGIALKKFVIPNPFGPYEEARFTTFLARTWLKNERAPVSHPSYVRDNIHAPLLAKAYSHFIESPLKKINPSGYKESQRDFTARFAKEMRTRLNRPCEFELKEQTDFSEPRIRVNTDSLSEIDWDEKKAWDSLAEFYLKTYD